MNSLLRTWKAALRLLVDTLSMLRGWLVYAVSGTTPPGSYQAFVRLFCRSGGISNDLLTRAIVLTDRRQVLPAPSGQLGIADARQAELAADHIREHGYFVFPQRLAEQTCERLLRFSLSTPAVVRPMSGAPRSPTPRRAVYDRLHPEAVRYDFDPGDVLSCEDVQDLMANPSLLNVAQSYLGSTPIADVTSMWWHTAFSDQPDEEAAQYFHFDLDRVRWLKIFIYLTDVGQRSGAHCFVRGSHRTGGIPKALLARGYTRLPDEDVARHYRADETIEFLAPRGTIIAEDTRGLHKGKAVHEGDRLMLQLQFSNSLFGGTYPSSRFGAVRSESLAQMLRSHKAVYVNYTGRGGSP
jgi:hypothetical protein